MTCDNCPDQCEDIDYSYTATQADFVDPKDYFLKALLRSAYILDISICKSKFYRKGNDERPTLNKGFFKEYETYIHDIFGKSVEIKGPPIASKDPRDDFAGCLEKTLRNKVKKMTYLHVYFKVIKQEELIKYCFALQSFDINKK